MIFVTRRATFTACGPKVQGTLKGKWRMKNGKRTLQIKETKKNEFELPIFLVQKHIQLLVNNRSFIEFNQHDSISLICLAFVLKPLKIVEYSLT
jgi:hypothetical protein